MDGFLLRARAGSKVGPGGGGAGRQGKAMLVFFLGGGGGRWAVSRFVRGYEGDDDDEVGVRIDFAKEGKGIRIDRDTP